MRLCIAARRVGLAGLRGLEDRLRLLLGSWTCRIRQATVILEDMKGRRNGLDIRCDIEAELIPSGKVSVQGLGADVETALAGAARRLVRRVKGEFYRRRLDTRVGARMAGSADDAGPSGTDDEG